MRRIFSGGKKNSIYPKNICSKINGEEISSGQRTIISKRNWIFRDEERSKQMVNG